MSDPSLISDVLQTYNVGGPYEQSLNHLLQHMKQLGVLLPFPGWDASQSQTEVTQQFLLVPIYTHI